MRDLKARRASISSRADPTFATNAMKLPTSGYLAAPAQLYGDTAPLVAAAPLPINNRLGVR